MIRDRGFKNFLIDALIYLVLALFLLSCLLPFIHELAVSLSSRADVAASRVGLLPVNLTFDNYGAVGTKDRFLDSVLISLLRLVIAVPATLLMIVITAYPLSMDRIPMPGRQAFMAIMIFLNLFQVGLIPRFLSYKALGLTDNFAVYIIPLLINTFNIILVANFFRGLPFELVESAMLDGANHIQILFKIMVPLSTPMLATISLFTIVQHWNSWFDGIIFMRDVKLWPLQSYLYTMLTNQQLSGEFGAHRFSGIWPNVSPAGAEAAMVFFAVLPVLIMYPLLQRYIISGMTLGAVKE
ncbi:MAG: carbohydrate ABC transporter permease [Chloroflexi bacterium]|nr:MAG: carbohydrate ABC transporter permease [Chloroflexota bacterium]